MPTERPTAPKPGVLVVDDERQILDSLVDLLRRDYRVFATDDIAEALRVLETQEIAIVLTDQRMPKTTGAELLARAARISPDTLRVLFTGYSDIQAVIQAVNEGRMYYFLAKPWDPEKLLAMVASAARHHNLVQENRKLMRQMAEVNGKSAQALPPPAVDDLEVSRLETENHTLNASLDKLVRAFDHLKTVQHIIATCMECGKLRTEPARWEEVGQYLKRNKIFLSHGYCPECEGKVLKEMGLERETV